MNAWERERESLSLRLFFLRHAQREEWKREREKETVRAHSCWGGGKFWGEKKKRAKKKKKKVHSCTQIKITSLRVWEIKQIHEHSRATKQKQKYKLYTYIYDVLQRIVTVRRPGRGGRSRAREESFENRRRRRRREGLRIVVDVNEKHLDDVLVVSTDVVVCGALFVARSSSSSSSRGSGRRCLSVSLQQR